MYNLITLPNGLRVAIENIDYVNSVSVGLWIENGSRNENTYNNGISHFLEHMFFKGTINRTSKKIVEEIEDVGGQVNAFTGKEATCFYIKILDSYLELSMDILADMLFNSSFKEEEILKEKGVIIEEISMSEDSPEDTISDLHSLAIWGDDPISLPILGTIETVNSFTRNQLLEYLALHYIPKNSVLSISGKINMADVEKLVQKYFGHWGLDRLEKTSYTSPVILKNNYYKYKSIEQLHVSLGLKGIETGQDDIYSLLVLCNIFGGGASSILFQKVREEKGLCYSIYSYISSFKNTGVVNIYTSLNPLYIKDAMELIYNEVVKFSKDNISIERINKTKEQIKGNYILGLESTSSRMFSNGKSVLFQNFINTPDILIGKVNKIDKTSIARVIEKTFSLGILNSAFVGEKFDMGMIKSFWEGDIVAFKDKKSRRV
ncbi:MAG TPA: pitrilysin family protein [Clostridiaceae bacterium]